MVRVLQIPRLYSITGFPRWLFPGKSGNTQPPCAEKKTFSESSLINRYIHDECKSMWMYVYMYILFHKRCVLHFVGGYPVCRHTMIKLWSWEYPGCEFEDFWNMERKYGLKTYQLTGVSSHFLPANDLILTPHLELKTWDTPKNSQKVGTELDLPNPYQVGESGFSGETRLQVGTTMVSWEQSWSSCYGQHLCINDLVAGHGCWNTSAGGWRARRFGVCTRYIFDDFSRLGSRIMGGGWKIMFLSKF